MDRWSVSYFREPTNLGQTSLSWRWEVASSKGRCDPTQALEQLWTWPKQLETVSSPGSCRQQNWSTDMFVLVQKNPRITRVDLRGHVHPPPLPPSDITQVCMVNILTCHRLIEIKPLYFMSLVTWLQDCGTFYEIKWSIFYPPHLHLCNISRLPGRAPAHRLKWENLAELPVLTT